MYISGACPGTTLVQIGAGRYQAVWTLLGGLAGTFFFAQVVKTLNWHKGTKAEVVEEKLNTKFYIIAFSISIPLFLALILLEYITNFGFLPTFPSMRQPSWSPIIAGSLLGLIQLPAARNFPSSLSSQKTQKSEKIKVLFVGNPLGVSTAYESALGLFSKNNYLKQTQTEANKIQLLFTVSSIFGAFISSYLSGVISRLISFYFFHLFSFICSCC